MAKVIPKHGALVVLLRPGITGVSGVCYARQLGFDTIACVLWHDGKSSPMSADLTWDTRQEVLLWPFFGAYLP